MACNAPNTPNTVPPRMSRMVIIGDSVFGLIREFPPRAVHQERLTRLQDALPLILTSGPGSCAKHCFYKFLGARRATYTHDYWPHIRPSSQLECQEATTLPLCRNQFLHSRNRHS